MAIKKQPELIADLCTDAIVYSGFRFAPGETFQVLKPGRSVFDAWPSHTPKAKNACGFSARHGHKKNNQN